jgi:hypothetical protein
MDGWRVMGGPLAAVVQLGALAIAVVAVVWLARRLSRRAPAPPPAAVRRPPAPDSSVLAAYHGALLDGWPPGELATFIEVGRQTGTSGAHVEAVIARHRAA